ncbi:unnamed protein product [Microthlaspi erraticum]|uniref:Uncharacterized protein n=1 Tax=Microthlaspi erraticum TaxID=1685480 RepID=A0A6D2LBW2_9BRAS|nr:unnamed protein product [Microthlaspi erraticum]
MEASFRKLPRASDSDSDSEAGSGHRTKLPCYVESHQFSCRGCLNIQIGKCIFNHGYGVIVVHVHITMVENAFANLNVEASTTAELVRLRDRSKEILSNINEEEKRRNNNN